MRRRRPLLLDEHGNPQLPPYFPPTFTLFMALPPSWRVGLVVGWAQIAWWLVRGLL